MALSVATGQNEDLAVLAASELRNAAGELVGKSQQILEGNVLTKRDEMNLVVAPNAAAIVLGALGLIDPALATVANNGSPLIAALVGVAPLLRG